MQLKGIDISHWNQKDTIDKNALCDFVIMKVTEGKTFKDPDYQEHNQKALFYGLYRGFYHFARPDLGNTPTQEAYNFIEEVHNKNKAIYALDIEGKAVEMPNIDTWALEWLNTVEAHTGVKPIVYLSQSQTKKFPKVCANNNGLWVARYRPRIMGYGDVKPWKFATIWQYTSEPLDKNIFYGNENQLQKYMKGDTR